ncbi:hypothetical protein [Streptomyces antibioticus]|uniref:hypothetical protein n=1 Tax=Streptomyces antibioticus TaxID=1890 RepID=UPI0033AFBEAD
MSTSGIGGRAAELRAALEEAVGVPAQAFPVSRGTRVSAPAPASDDWARWRQVIAVLGRADDWGSSSLTGTPEVWAEVDEGTPP